MDQNLVASLCSTISATILPYCLELESCTDIWSTVEKRLQASNRSRVIQFKNELYNVAMKNQTIAQYFLGIKSLVDNIAASRAKIDVEDIILYTLNDLPSQISRLKQPFAQN